MESAAEPDISMLAFLLKLKFVCTKRKELCSGVQLMYTGLWEIDLDEENSLSTLLYLYSLVYFRSSVGLSS
jgi:hypothetical protein